MSDTRRIFKNSSTSQNHIKELLQIMFLSEIVAPAGERVWLVSPWISNFVMFDNRAGVFNTICPDWANRQIRLVEVLAHLVERGGKIGIVTNLDAHNDSFVSSVEGIYLERQSNDVIFIVRKKHLHVKGLLVSRGLLTGSMNLTYNGLEINDEMVVYDISSRPLAEARINFQSYLTE